MVQVYNEQSVLKAAHRYAAFDKSDPFALARALCHIAQGLCGYTEDGKEGWYDATEQSSIDKDGNVRVMHTNVFRP